MLAIKNLQFERNEQPLFEPVNLEVPASSCLQLSAPNGIGKTTLLKILAGLAPARRGKIFWQQKAVPSLAPYAKYLGHELALTQALSVLENLQYYAALFHGTSKDIADACHFFELTPLHAQPIHTLSAGQKHRCQLAKLMIGAASIWFLDEPFTGLDHLHVQKLLHLFSHFLATGGIIIFTSHHPISNAQFPIKLFLLNPHHASAILV